jgi:predicted secreted protein with PEFG-CTERM motif
MLTSILLGALILSAIPNVLAEEIKISIPAGSSSPGCDETNECYVPNKVTVNPGDTVVWSNDDTAAHTVTSGTPSDGPDGNFDSSLFAAGTTFSNTFDTLGEYNYFCMVHPWMKGSVLVTVGGMPETNLGAITIGNTVKNSSDNNLMAEIIPTNGKQGEQMTIDIKITDLQGNPPQHLTYNIQAAQGTTVLLNEEGHMHEGTTTATYKTKSLPVAASDATPVNITVNAVGFGHGDQYVGSFGEIAAKKVVPEFGPLVLMILTLSIVSIIAITRKSGSFLRV